MLGAKSSMAKWFVHSVIVFVRYKLGSIRFRKDLLDDPSHKVYKRKSGFLEISFWESQNSPLQVIWWRNEKARPKNFNAVSHNHVRS